MNASNAEFFFDFTEIYLAAFYIMHQIDNTSGIKVNSDKWMALAIEVAGMWNTNVFVGVLTCVFLVAACIWQLWRATRDRTWQGLHRHVNCRCGDYHRCP